MPTFRSMPQAPNRRTQSSLLPAPVRDAWVEAAESFLLEKRRARCSAATLEQYRFHLLGNRTTAWRADHAVSAPSDATSTALRAFQAELVDAGLSPATQSKMHRVIGTFLRFCEEEGLAIDHRSLRLKPPRQPQRQPRDYTDEEIRRLFDAVDNERDRFLMLLLLRTGLRLHEAVSLTLDDRIMTAEGPAIRVRHETAKGSKERVVPMDSATVRLSREWNRYVRDVRPNRTDRRELFISARRYGDDFESLTTNAVKVMLRRLGHRAGVPHAGAHRFRHSYATRFRRAGGSQEHLARILGHSTAQVTSIYGRWEPEPIVKAFADLPV
jgi:integrase/recombinase XerD